MSLSYTNEQSRQKSVQSRSVYSSGGRDMINKNISENCTGMTVTDTGKVRKEGRSAVNGVGLGWTFRRISQGKIH